MAFNQEQEMQGWGEPWSPNGTLTLEFNDDWCLFNNTPLEFFNDAEYMQYDDDLDNTEVVAGTSDEIEMNEQIKEGNYPFYLLLIISIMQMLKYISKDNIC